MFVILLMPRLSLHAIQDQTFRSSVTHHCSEEQRIHRLEVPRAKSLPHEMHGCGSQRHKVGKRVVEEEDLMSLRVVRPAETGLVVSVSCDLEVFRLGVGDSLSTYKGDSNGITRELLYLVSRSLQLA